MMRRRPSSSVMARPATWRQPRGGGRAGRHGAAGDRDGVRRGRRVSRRLGAEAATSPRSWRPTTRTGSLRAAGPRPRRDAALAALDRATVAETALGEAEAALAAEVVATGFGSTDDSLAAALDQRAYDDLAGRLAAHDQRLAAVAAVLAEPGSDALAAADLPDLDVLADDHRGGAGRPRSRLGPGVALDRARPPARQSRRRPRRRHHGLGAATPSWTSRRTCPRSSRGQVG